MDAFVKLFLTVLANVVNTLEVLPIASNFCPLLRTHCYQDLSAILAQGQEESTVVVVCIFNQLSYCFPTVFC